MDRERTRIAEAEPGMRGLRRGILIYRWASLAIMGFLAAIVGSVRPWLSVLIFLALVTWNATVTVRDAWDRPSIRWIDLGLSAALMAAAPLTVEPGSLTDHPFVAAAYPMSSVLTCAAADGVPGGLIAAIVLWVPLIASRPLNGLSYADLPAGEILSVITGCVYYVVGAVTIGLFATTLARAADDLGRANALAMREHERAARAAERESLTRALHDSVLQVLAIVIRRGREMAAQSKVAGDEVGALIELIEHEEHGLRALLRSGVDRTPEGGVPLRTVLEAASFGIDGVPVAIIADAPAWVASEDVADLAAAVRQGLENAAVHAQASQVQVIGARDGDEVLVRVLDDGKGFVFDADALRRDARFGITESMQGRIEARGGRMQLRSSPGRGTEVEFRLPVRV
jgi:signal transduction histidine kinase